MKNGGKMTRTYDKLKDEDQLDRELKAALSRGDSEKKIDALIEQYEPPKKVVPGEIL